jgi:hypothetical protein
VAIRLLAAARDGWASAKANVVPGLVLVTLAALLVAAYYLVPAVAASLSGLVALRERMGILFAMLGSAVGAGIIPGVYLILAGRWRRGRRGAGDLAFTCLFWSLSALVLDRFYLFQSLLWGTAVTVPVVLAKMLLDQLVFTPLVGVQIPALGTRLRDMDYSFPALGRALRGDWIFGVTAPMLVACWLTWVPGTLVIYSLPLPLQIPMMVCFQCFFALEMAYASSRMQAPADAPAA